MSIRKAILEIVYPYAKRVANFLRYLLKIEPEEPDPLSGLAGDRAIEYAFCVKALFDLPKQLKVLDVGCSGSPLTTIIRSIGFSSVDGIDFLPSPVRYKGIRYIQDDFLESNKLDDVYDAIVMCSTIEHVGLEGRYTSPSVKNGDIDAIRRGFDLLRPDGVLILTIPYGIENIIMPFHRVYNKHSSDMLKYLFKHFETIDEEYFMKDTLGVWEKCSETEAGSVNPTESKYALGMYVFRKSSVSR